MKKTILTLTAMFIAVNVFAQTEQNEETRMQKEILKTFHITIGVFELIWSSPFLQCFPRP